MAEALTLENGGRSSTLRDVFALGKPRLSTLVLSTAALGLWFAPGAVSPLRTFGFLLGTALLVFAANALNCVIERDVDARMRRTRGRPLPAGRLPVRGVRVGAGMLAAGALILLTLAANPLTAALGAAAFLSYVAAYTPLKRISSLSLYVGAIPGALPPLMGWTATTGQLQAGGWALFGILFFWQVPHFLAIALFSREDYERGGLRVMSVAHGALATRIQLLLGAIGLLVVSLWPARLGLAGEVYGAVAFALGLLFVLYGLRGLSPAADEAWARRVFRYSLIYLPLLTLALLFG